MSTPFVFVSVHRIPDGRLEELEALSRAFADFVAANEPDVLGFYLWAREDGSELVHLSIQPDAAAMDAHLQRSQEWIAAALELAPTISIHVYAAPGPVLADVLERNREAGVPVTVERIRPLAGVSRLPTAA